MRAARVTAVVCLLAFVVLTVLVWTGATTHLDVVTRDHFRPHDVWGEAQLRADHVVEGLKPSHDYALLVLGAVVLTLVRRSWRPALFLGLVAGASVVATVAVKVLLERTDPHGDLSTLGGSYPSGHTIAVWACLGGLCLAAVARTPWWAWLGVGGVATLMGWCLLLQGAHWLTDVVGGSLLAVAVLALASTVSLRPERSPRRSPEPAVR